MHLQPLICVRDVEASSRWYQQLLGLKSGHGGQEYEQLTRDGKLVLQLHRWEVEHHHGPLGDPELQPYGNGVVLWFEVEDFEAAVARVHELGARVHKPSELSENGNWEIWLQDPNGYKLVLASPLGIELK